MPGPRHGDAVRHRAAGTALQHANTHCGRRCTVKTVCRASCASRELVFCLDTTNPLKPHAKKGQQTPVQVFSVVHGQEAFRLTICPEPIGTAHFSSHLLVAEARTTLGSQEVACSSISDELFL